MLAIVVTCSVQQAARLTGGGGEPTGHVIEIVCLGIGFHMNVQRYVSLISEGSLACEEPQSNNVMAKKYAFV
jgi:hypothetical protein